MDCAGPFEVFSVTGLRNGLQTFDVYTVAEHARPVTARNQLSVNPRYPIRDCPQPDILVVPGGYGTRVQMENTAVIEWITVRPQFTIQSAKPAHSPGDRGLSDEP